MFEGKFKSGQRSGMGKTTLLDGTIIEGNYLNDQKHGEFTSTSKDGIVENANF